MTKSHVGMDLCFYCGEPKGVVLHKRLRDVLPEKAVYDREPCDKCKGYMQQGIILISVRDDKPSENPYRTGGWVVVTRDYITRALEKRAADHILSYGWAFVPDQAWKAMGLPYGEVEGQHDER